MSIELFFTPNQTLTQLNILFSIVMVLLSALFFYESWREQESRALKFGLAGVVIHACFILLSLYVESIQPFITIYYLTLIIFALILLIPGKNNLSALKGTAGHIIGDVSRFDERDIVFSRNDDLSPGSEQYRQYYEMHPEREERDALRRSKGSNLGKLCSIDNSPAEIVNMVIGFQSNTQSLLASTRPEVPEKTEPLSLDPVVATEKIKNLAIHLGADLVGVCKIDKRWIYSHQGRCRGFEDIEWGDEIKSDYSYAVVIATEMDHEIMNAAPHSPVVMETMRNYSKGAFITTAMANWFTRSGYKAVANHVGYYESLMVPLAIDAGIGQYSRMGYLISEKFGGRMRLAAVLTDMPMVPDKPVDLGVDEFCLACKKCADSCPSRSIPNEGKTLSNGILRWIIDNETCHDYWARVGTDCGVCMSVCPFSRPDRSFHILVKWLLKYSWVARRILPHLDNIIYGKQWKVRRSPEWVSYKA